MMLGVRELEKIQAAFPDLRMELVGGKVVVMSPSDLLSSAPREGRMREEPRGLRQLRATVSQSVARWSEAPAFLPHPAGRPST